jgi:ATP-dependent Clp protease ATP-binding subunit ClpC
MFRDFSEQANNVIKLAHVEARALNHEYVGTEHLLLALVAEESGVATEILRTLDVTANAIRQGVESLVQRGPASVSTRALPLTPRSVQVIEFAREEARDVSQQFVNTEHLLLALLREPDGVAGHVLRNLGVKPDELRAEALKVRIELMKIVERVVRPVRASTPWKRRMRDELFAHLTGIYEQEVARLKSPALALEQAARRFGEPAELTGELECALPAYERFSRLIERWMLYRAPESAARYSLRLATNTFWLLAGCLGLVMFGVVLVYGWIAAVQTLASVFAAILFLTPPMQFVIVLALIKMRDAMWGAFGSRKSLGHVFAYSLVIAAAAQLYLMGVATVARLDFGAGIEAARVSGMIGVISAIAFLALAYVTGRDTIRDTKWALLDIETA